MQLNAYDFLNAFSEIDDSQKLIQDTVKKFISEKLKPHIHDYYEQGVFPYELVKEMGALGLLGSNLTGYGCAGLDEVSYGIIMKELERGDSGLRSFASVQSSLAMYAIHTFGSEEQKKYFLPRMAQGEWIGCFGLTEPDFGSNPSGMKTFAKQHGDHWILNGSKTWITNAPIAHVAVVWAQTEQGVRGFLVEKDSKGFSAPKIHHKLSLRASVTGSLFFDNCVVPNSHVLQKSEGIKSALMCLNQARFGIIFGVLGAAEDCLDEALSYTSQRIVFHKPLSGHQLIQRKLALMSSEIAKGNLLAMQLAKLKHSKKVHPAQVSMGKQSNVQMALDCARTTRDILGANGISGEYRCMRHMCNLESVYTYEGTNDIHLLIVGEKLTGISAFG
ncbi:Acyl-CoA dehydrogenase [Spirobacillus cienkowskii]